MFNGTWKAAIARAFIGAFVVGGSSFVGQLATGSSLRAALVAGGVAFFGILIIRGGAEGFVDAKAALAAKAS